ncbi:ATP-binding protein [Candidatus Zixiibacteriota bacterium]
MFGSKYKTQTKVYVLFLLALGLPSLILGSLALRGIKNDRALAEQELLSQHEGIAGALIRQLETDLHQMEVTLSSFLHNHPTFAEADLHSAIKELKTLTPFVDVVFAVKPDALVFPPTTILYNPPELAEFTKSDRGPQPLDRLIRTAEHLEFVSGEYAQAKSMYERAFSSASSRPVRADLLLRIGRTAKKAARYREAAETFERLVRDYDQITLPGGLPAGLVARLELATLLLEKSEVDTAGSILLNTYRDLSNRKWNVSRSQFEFATARVTTLRSLADSQSKGSSSAMGAAFDSVVQETNFRIALTEKLFKIETNIYPLIKERLNRARLTAASNHRLSVGEGTKSLPVVLVATPNERKDHIEAVGALLSMDEMRSVYLPSLLSDQQLPVNSSLLLRDDLGEVIAGSIPSTSARQTLTKSLAGNFPPWSIELYQQDPEFFEGLLQSRRSNYVYFLALILGVLAFGVFFTMRMMSREIRLAKLKSDFVSTVSHEFRSPLTSIRQLAEMLVGGRVPSEERRQHYYQVILEQSERLSHLVTNILDLDRIEDGIKELKYELVDLSRLLEDIVAKMQQQSRHEGYVITLDIPHRLPAIRLDPSAITQVMDNLIDNSIKYSGNSKDVTVRAHAESGNVIIAVKDYGLGIKKEEIGKIFERFYRGGDELTRSVKGSGLGLALVQQLVHAHQGTVAAQSEPGQGTVFSIKLPVEPPEDEKHGKNSHR